jgi:hypothetical protein
MGQERLSDPAPLVRSAVVNKSGAGTMGDIGLDAQRADS